MVKNTNWLEVNQLDIFTSVAEDLNSDYGEQIQHAVRAGLELGASELQVQCPNHSATLPQRFI